MGGLKNKLSQEIEFESFMKRSESTWICDIDLGWGNTKWIRDVCEKGYRKTGLKFDVIFRGSKGYVVGIEINAEGVKSLNNHALLGFTDEVEFSVFYSPKIGVSIKEK